MRRQLLLLDLPHDIGAGQAQLPRSLLTERHPSLACVVRAAIDGVCLIGDWVPGGTADFSRAFAACSRFDDQRRVAAAGARTDCGRVRTG